MTKATRNAHLTKAEKLSLRHEQFGSGSTYTEEVGERICMLLCGIGVPNGRPLSLRRVAQEPDMPTINTMKKWIIDFPEFGERFNRARQLGLDIMADEVIDIADGRYATEEGEDYDSAKVRMQFDARRWYLSKVAPKRYGEKVTTEHTGPDGTALPAPAGPQFVVMFGDGVREYTSKQHPDSMSPTEERKNNAPSDEHGA